MQIYLVLLFFSLFIIPSKLLGDCPLYFSLAGGSTRLQALLANSDRVSTLSKHDSIWNELAAKIGLAPLNMGYNIDLQNNDVLVQMRVESKNGVLILNIQSLEIANLPIGRTPEPGNLTATKFLGSVFRGIKRQLKDNEGKINKIQIRGNFVTVPSQKELLRSLGFENNLPNNIIGTVTGGILKVANVARIPQMITSSIHNLASRNSMVLELDVVPESDKK